MLLILHHQTDWKLSQTLEHLSMHLMQDWMHHYDCNVICRCYTNHYTHLKYYVHQIDYSEIHDHWLGALRFSNQFGRKTPLTNNGNDLFNDDQNLKEHHDS